MADGDGRWATDLAQPLVGQSFVQLCVGVGDCQLNFSGDFGITFESPVRFGPSVADPVEPFALEGIALFLPLLNGDVTAVRVSDEGSLTVTVGETAIHCDADPAYEAWNFSGAGWHVVCLPGGGLTSWTAA